MDIPDKSLPRLDPLPPPHRIEMPLIMPLLRLIRRIRQLRDLVLMMHQHAALQLGCDVGRVGHDEQERLEVVLPGGRVGGLEEGEHLLGGGEVGG